MKRKHVLIDPRIHSELKILSIRLGMPQQELLDEAVSNFVQRKQRTLDGHAKDTCTA